MIEEHILVPTKDGQADTFACKPERGGPHPVVIFLMDAPGIREELRDMVRRLASAGYYVLLPNLYYRVGHGIEPLTEARGNPFPRIIQLMNTLTNALVLDDVKALLAHVDATPAARSDRVGCVGYCMSGQYALSAAGAFADRIAAAAVFYGTNLHTDAPDSPHLLAARAKAELYIAQAEVDEYAPAEMVENLKRALGASPAKFEVEFYKGVAHGFAFPQRDCFDKPAAERHWERLHALYRRNLQERDAQR